MRKECNLRLTDKFSHPNHVESTVATRRFPIRNPPPLFHDEKGCARTVHKSPGKTTDGEIEMKEIFRFQCIVDVVLPAPEVQFLSHNQIH